MLKIVLVLLTAASLVPDVQAQAAASKGQDLRDARAEVVAVVEDLRPKLFGDLKAKEADVYRQLRFVVTMDDQNINAAATPDYAIEIPLAMGRAIPMNVDAFLIEQGLGRNGFLADYMEHVAIQRAKRAPFIKSPYEYAAMDDHELEEFFADQKLKDVRIKLIGSAFSFLLCHEVAHQVFDHPRDAAVDYAERRRRETEADAWAINRVISKGVTPIGGIIPLLISYFTVQHPITRESGSTHPADARRLRAMYEGMLSRLPSFRSAIAASGQDYSQFEQQLRAAIKMVDDELAED